MTPPTGQNDFTGLRAGRVEDNYKALGIAVSLMMTDANFGRLTFGHWSRVLAGQIRRSHYIVVADGPNMVGFLGWALTDRARAESWLKDAADLAFEHSLSGDCLLINAWLAKTDRVNRFILSQLRFIGKDQKMVYAKRFYRDGRVRKLKLPVNAFVPKHIARTSKPAG